MTEKKNFKTKSEKIPEVAGADKVEVFSSRKSIDQIIKERGIKPIKDDGDFDRIFGSYKEWFDVDQFLKEAHKQWK